MRMRKQTGQPEPTTLFHSSYLSNIDYSPYRPCKFKSRRGGGRSGRQWMPAQAESSRDRAAELEGHCRLEGNLWAEGLAQPETGAFVGATGQRPQVAAQKLRVPMSMKAACHRGSQWRQARSSRSAAATAVDSPLTSVALPKAFLHTREDSVSAEGTGAALIAGSHWVLQPSLGVGSARGQAAGTAGQALLSSAQNKQTEKAEVSARHLARPAERM